MHEIVKTIAGYVVNLAEAAAAIIIVAGAVHAFWIFIRRALIKERCYREITLGRMKLGHSLLLGLDFLIGADILRTVVTPNWNDIGQLASIIAIRTILNFFLMRELEQEERDIAG
jgi:uncharacterized membrane protein